MRSGPYDGHRNAALLAGLNLRGLRRDCGIKVKTVAAALGVTPQAVSNWESGRWHPSGKPGAAYARFMLGLARHVTVSCG
jgi:DNA-binding transcriptional regulator YiaG